MKIRTDIKAGDACYTVQSGDNLSYIARDFYGNESADSVGKIYYSNEATIGPDPNLITPGNEYLLS